MALLLRQNGTAQHVAPDNGKHFILKELQDAVGGLVEVIKLKPKSQSKHNEHYILVAHEEAKFVESNTINHPATKIADIAPEDYVSGDVILCKSSEVL